MNILIPTDFSAFAKEAFEHACNLAKRLGARLYIFHAGSMPDSWEDRTYSDRIKDHSNREIAARITQRLEKLRREAVQSGISAHIQISGEPFVKNLQKYVDRLSIGLVVIGSHGTGQSKAYWGSHTQAVVRELEGMVLVIEQQQAPLNISSVMFATSLDQKDRKVLQDVLVLFRDLEIDHLHIVAIDTPNYFDQPTEVMARALSSFKDLVYDLECSTHFYRSDSIDSGILKFSQEHQIDLIAMANSHKSALMRIFQGSKLERLIAKSDIPILSIS